MTRRDKERNIEIRSDIDVECTSEREEKMRRWYGHRK